MADLPSNSPQMFQLPGPQVPYQGNLATGAAAGLVQGQNYYLQQQQNQLQQQQLDMQKQQQTISQVDTLLKSGMNYPGMLPTFWPAIATRMNSLSPDYKLDPNNPPDNLPNFAKQLSSISDGLQDKVVSPPQAHAATLQLIQSSYPTPTPSDAGQTAGAPGPQGAPTMQTPQQGQPQPGMAPQQGQPQQPGMGQPPSQGQPQQQPWDISQFGKNPTADFVNLKPLYDKQQQVIHQAPLEGLQSQDALQKAFDNSSLSTMYKKTLENLSAQYGAGQENTRNKFNQDQDSVRTLASEFSARAPEFQNVSKSWNVFNSQIQAARSALAQGDNDGAAAAQKAAVLAFGQMNFPGTGRPSNPQMLDSMEKSGPAGELVNQWVNKALHGPVMTADQLSAFQKAGFNVVKAREASQTDDENSTASAISTHGANPRGFLTNQRPSNLLSTSKIFPNQSSIQAPLVGAVHKLTVNGKPGTYQLIGNDPNPAKGNWVPVDSNGQ